MAAVALIGIAHHQGAVADSEIARSDLLAQWWMVMLAGGQLALTAVGVVYIAATLRSTDAAVAEAKNATEAANTTISVTQDANRRQLRAYMVIDEIDDANRYSDVEPFTYFVKCRNAGQTPAYDVRVSSYIMVDKSDRPFDYPEPHMGGHVSRSIVGPGSLYSFSEKLGAPFTADEYSQISDGSATIHIWGVIHYRDAFDTEHFTRYRYVSLPAAPQFILTDAFEGNTAS